MDPELNFQKRLVEYLESVHIGEFMTRPMETVVSDVECQVAQDPEYRNPTDTSSGYALFKQTEVDPMTEALNIKTGEPWLNTVTPVLTYVLRCNTDVTSLLSGTAVKAVVAYISDYVTKTALKTYTMFDSIKGVYERNSEMLSGSFARKEKARRLVTQMVNSLTAKSEIGAPMAAMYLLGNPDHYTSHDFVPFYWKSFVHHIFFQPESDDVEDCSKGSEKVLIQNNAGRYVAYSAVFDYIYRPLLYSHLPLYTWIQTSQKCKIPKDKSKTPTTVATEPNVTEDTYSDDELNIVEASQEVIDEIPLQSDSEDAYDADSDDENDELDVMSAVDDSEAIQSEKHHV